LFAAACDDDLRSARSPLPAPDPPTAVAAAGDGAKRLLFGQIVPRSAQRFREAAMAQRLRIADNHRRQPSPVTIADNLGR
jgi:hypothetical protein